MSRTPSEGFGLEDDRDDLPFQIHHELDDAPLSVWAFRVYAHLVRRAGKDGKIFPSYQSIGEACFRPSYGPSANPKSLRNKAMIAMKELVEAGLVLKAERTRKGSKESDTNTYQLTPRRKWLDALKVKREALAAETEKASTLRKSERAERGGGIVGVPPSTVGMPQGGTGGMPRGTVGVPEVSSIEVLQSLEVLSKEGGGFSSTENARAETQPEPSAPPVAVMNPPVPTTTDSASLQTQNTQAAEEVQTAGEVSTPDGVFEDAPSFTDEDIQALFEGSDEDAQALEQVPCGPAAGRAAVESLMAALPEASGADSPQASAVDLLRGIPEAELLGRVAATPADANYKTIVGMVGGKKVIEDGILDGNTPTGGVPRRYWLRLTTDELGQIRTLAQVEAKATQTSFLTLCILGLDRMVGAPRKTEKAAVPLGTAYESPEVQRQREEAMQVEVGSTWFGRKSGKPFVIEESNGKSVFVEGLGEYPMIKFHQLFVAAD